MLDVSGVRAALCHTGWVPRSERQALAVAELALVDDGDRVLETAEGLPEAVPVTARSRVHPPQVIATSRGYRVKLCIYSTDPEAAYYGEALEFLSCCAVEVGPATLDRRCDELYFGGDVPSE